MTTTAEPVVLVKRTKTAGYQVIYRSAGGKLIVRDRGLDYVTAVRVASSLARVSGCLLEVDQ